MALQSPLDLLSDEARLRIALRSVLPNGQDVAVVEKLLIPGPDRQKIDARDPDSQVPLSVSMAIVYIRAARARHGDVATTKQITLVKQALSGLKTACERLVQIVPEASRSLEAALGDATHDLRGIDEANELIAICNKILNSGLTEATLKLEAALDSEKAKPRRKGEHRKRLRSLIESLVDWWIQR